MRALLATFAALCSFAAAADLPPPVKEHPVGWCILAKPEAFAAAKAAGFEYVELAMQTVLPLSDAEFETLAGQLRASGVPALSGYNVVPKEIPLVGPAVNVAQQDEHLRHVLRRAAELKLKFLILNAGASWRVPDGFAPDEARRQLAAFGRRFATMAAKENIVVLVEPLRRTDSNLLVTIAEAIALVDAVQHPNFQMMVDYSFLRITKDDVEQVRRAGPRLRHVHLANPDKTPRVYPAEDGESDYAPFFAALQAIDYPGAISVHAGVKDFASEAPRAIAFLRRKMTELANARATSPARP